MTDCGDIDMSLRFVVERNMCHIIALMTIAYMIIKLHYCSGWLGERNLSKVQCLRWQIILRKLFNFFWKEKDLSQKNKYESTKYREKQPQPIHSEYMGGSHKW